MSVVQPGGDKQSGAKPGSGRGQGQRPSSGQRQPKAGQRPPSAGGRSQTKPGSGAARGAQRGPGGRPPGKGPTAGRRVGTPVAERGPRRLSPTNMAYGAIALVVLVVIAIVVVKVAGGGPSTSSGLAPSVSPAPASLLSELTGVSTSVENTVGLPSTSLVTAPKLVKNQTPLTSGGKPEALYIGAEFCPFCAAERWAMIVAFSRFGTFSGIQETTSSPWDTPPAIPTFTFASAHYSSSLVHFTMVEHESNDKSGLGTRTILQPLTSQQSKLWSTYEAHFGASEGYPFIDIGNKVFVVSPSYDPAILSGLNQSAIAAQLTNPKSTITQAIVGSANYLTAGICSLTGQQPASVCTQSAVTQAAKAIGVS